MMARKRTAVAGAIALLTASSALGALPGQAGAANGSNAAAFTANKAVTRTHIVAGADQVVEKRTVSVSVSSTTALRDRQAITVDWTGAHPTGGLLPDVNSGTAAEQEYPVVILQCRGKDSTSVPLARRVRPETCWTSTPPERYNASNFVFPPWRVDRYADANGRTGSPGQPNPIPTACAPFLGSGAIRWMSFVAADGTTYAGGGGSGCAGIPPEAVFVEGAVPSNQTYGQTDKDGNGTAKFVIQNADSNASLGCSDKVDCSLVVIPIMGISCDPDATGLPPVDQPTTYGARVVTSTKTLCSKTGHYTAGERSSGLGQEDVAVSGSLWWSASNWRNRISVPLSLAPSATVCSVLNTSVPAYVYGSESMIQTSLQWSPHFCLNSALFKFQHVQTPEPQAKNLLESGAIEAAFQAGPPSKPFSRPVVQAPIAYTGFAVATNVDDVDSHAISDLKLTPRLLAKLLSESYTSNPTVRGDFADLPASDPSHKLSENPLALSYDPEFRALNPTARQDPASLEAASTILAMSSDSDVISALSAYLNADPEARAFLDGTPDPWGMVVNPHYKGIALPVDNWPQLDTLVSKNMVTAGNSCLADSPVPWLPLVAAPVSQMAAITLAMQYGIANSQIICSNVGQPNQRLKAIGRQAPGARFTLGLVSLGDAARYQLSTAALLTHTASDAPEKFTNSTGRTFVQPSDTSLKAAAPFFKTDKTANTWRVAYDDMRTASSGSGAYPGALLMSLDVPTTGLPKADAARYATLLRFATGPGQVRGVQSGQLAPGFLPLTAANGLGAQAAFSQRAASAIQGQTGVLPLVAGGFRGGSTRSGGGGGTGSGSGSGAGAGGGGGSGSGGGVVPAAPAPSAAPVPSTAPSASPPVPVKAQAVGMTQGVESGLAGLLLPLVLGLALLGGLVIPLSAVLGRYRRRP